MLPLRLKIHGYRSYVDAEVNFAEYGPIVAITGENGAGKSSIIEMLTTALYYRNSCTDERGAGMDEVINANCDEFRLELDFTMNDVLYTVISAKKRGGNRELRFIVDGTDVSGKLADTQAKINEVLRLSYDTFMDTVCIGQGTSSKFMDKTPNERRAVFTQLLDLRRYEAYEKAAREQRKAAKDQLTELEAKVTLLESQQIDTAEVTQKAEQLAGEAERVDAELTQARDLLQAELDAKARYDELVSCSTVVLSARKKLTEQVERVGHEVEQLEDKLRTTKDNAPAAVDQADVDAAQAKVDDLRSQLTALREHMAGGKAKRSSLVEQANTARAAAERARTLGEGECPTCGAPITAQSRDAHVAELERSATELDERVARIDAKLADVDKQCTAVVSAGKEANGKLKQLTDQQRLAEAAQVKIDQLTQRLEAAQRTLAETKVQLDENMATNVKPVEPKTFDDVRLKANVKQLEGEAGKIATAQAVCTERLNTAKQLATDLAKTKKAATKAKQLYTDIGAVATAFSKTGIQARILASDLPEIEKECNEVIAALCDGELSIAFVTQDTAGKGKDKHTVETMDIEVRDVYGARRYASYSGGERFRVDFACHVGLARYLTRRAGATMDFFIIDEGLGSQDEAARQRFTEMLHRMRQFFKQILVITHIAEVQDAFDARVLVQKDPVKGSQVKVLKM